MQASTKKLQFQLVSRLVDGKPTMQWQAREEGVRVTVPGQQDREATVVYVPDYKSVAQPVSEDTVWECRVVKILHVSPNGRFYVMAATLLKEEVSDRTLRRRERKLAAAQPVAAAMAAA